MLEKDLWMLQCKMLSILICLYETLFFVVDSKYGWREVCVWNKIEVLKKKKMTSILIISLIRTVSVR